MKTISLVSIGLLLLFVGIYFTSGIDIHPNGNEYSEGMQHLDGTQEKLIARLKAEKIPHVIDKEGIIRHKRKDRKRVEELSDEIIKANYKPTPPTLAKPNICLYKEGANELLVKFLKENGIPHEVEYGANNKISKISWGFENNRSALEQILKVHKEYGDTNSPTSIKFMYPETQNIFEKKLQEKGYQFTRKGEYTSYGWDNWVDIEIIKKEVSKLDMERDLKIRSKQN